MNIYLDVDGVLLTKEGKPAQHLDIFLRNIVMFDCYWLTTHCKGNTDRVIGHLFNKIPLQSLYIAQTFKPTNWISWKTEAIDFTKDFLWLDDNIFVTEERVLKSHNCLHKFIKVDLINNPDQLISLFNK